MRKLRAWLLRFKGVFSKGARERDLAEEIESHLQMHIDDNIRAGMSPEEAKRVAVMKLGGVDQQKKLTAIALRFRSSKAWSRIFASHSDSSARIRHLPLLPP